MNIFTWLCPHCRRKRKWHKALESAFDKIENDDEFWAELRKNKDDYECDDYSDYMDDVCTNDLIEHCKALCNHVRVKYSMGPEPFSCEHMRGIEEALKDLGT